MPRDKTKRSRRSTAGVPISKKAAKRAKRLEALHYLAENMGGEFVLKSIARPSAAERKAIRAGDRKRRKLGPAGELDKRPRPIPSRVPRRSHALPSREPWPYAHSGGGPTMVPTEDRPHEGERLANLRARMKVLQATFDDLVDDAYALGYVAEVNQSRTATPVPEDREGGFHVSVLHHFRLVKVI